MTCQLVSSALVCFNRSIVIVCFYCKWLTVRILNTELAVQRMECQWDSPPCYGSASSFMFYCWCFLFVIFIF